MSNEDVIRRGGGSPQERSHRCGGDCPVCNPKDRFHSDPRENLTSGRYKKCGYGKPNYDQDGHYDEVFCAYSKEPLCCGDDTCPLDKFD